MGRSVTGSSNNFFSMTATHDMACTEQRGYPQIHGSKLKHYKKEEERTREGEIERGYSEGERETCVELYDILSAILISF